MGTPDYAASRVLRGATPTPLDDLEALGYLLVEMWRGELPWLVAGGGEGGGQGTWGRGKACTARCVCCFHAHAAATLPTTFRFASWQVHARVRQPPLLPLPLPLQGHHQEAQRRGVERVRRSRHVVRGLERGRGALVDRLAGWLAVRASLLLPLQHACVCVLAILQSQPCWSPLLLRAQRPQPTHLTGHAPAAGGHG